MKNQMEKLGTLLCCDERVYKNNEIMRNIVVELALNYDVKLIELLMSDEAIKAHFFLNINGTYIFKKEEFVKFIASREFLPDSYTRYRNKVGLASNDNLIKESRKVVLNWPYKDCVLEGGQDTEDAKREEVFYNEVLACDEIDRLFEPKVLTNFKKYDETGEISIDTIQGDENLIIKGNNLIALHSLKKKYGGEVKVIFIDPPYNTNNDSFNYNDRFTRSTWLTFMKNRLEVAKELLREDGLIWVTLSDVQAHYFKVLADEIFKEENFIADVIWQSRKSVSSDTFISLSTNHVFVYAKNKSILDKNKFRLRMDESKYKYEDEKGKYKIEPFDAPNIRKNLSYTITNPNTGESYLPPDGRCWRTTEEEYKRLLSEGRIAFGRTGNAKPQLKKYLSEDIEDSKGKAPTTLWNDIDTTTNATKDLEKLFGEKIFKNPKPESLIERILQLSSNEGDIVLDYHLGSGTTCAVAHKMNRKYIGVEQMNYVEDVSVERLQKVIEGEQTGISECLEWSGGGSFIYCELLQWNQVFVEKIKDTFNDAELNDIWNDMKEKSFLSYRVRISDIEASMPDFEKLPLDSKKTFLYEVLDKNHLYVNLSDMDDKVYNVSEVEKKLNRKFYSIDE
ncbi:DNA methyltransferase [Vallitalea guaymasensis]|uniref:DNA methyltransferase n=1 Tax=Vallitalea guaymasensis TaxID=1185412 RepID=UPI000DE3CC6D|nr:site-specific DNA-methyltransferase [Vallitalea guaymasensis]